MSLSQEPASNTDEDSTSNKRKKKKKKTKMVEETNPIVVVDLDSVDDDEVQTLRPTISFKAGTTQKDPILVESYADNRDLHRALLASYRQSLTGVIDLSALPDTHPDDDPRVIEAPPTPRKPSGNKRRRGVVLERGEPSNPKPKEGGGDDLDPRGSCPGPTFDCDICVESKPLSDLFPVQGCEHCYCSSCIGRYVAAKLEDNVAHISCPVSGCGGALHPDYCRSILPPRVFDRWGSALCDTVILDAHKLYCPYKDCSALLINDGNNGHGGELIQESECPYCRRLFCADCKVPWHTGFECVDFQKLGKEDSERDDDPLLMNLARSMNWKRCPKCMIYVERSQGCYFMKCRCGGAFCYYCGALNTTSNHICPNCHH